MASTKSIRVLFYSKWSRNWCRKSVYEIVFSGFISEADDTHGAEYLSDETGAAIKDLHFKLSGGNGKRMFVSQSIIFRFEKITTLKANTNLLGDEASSKVVVSDVNLLMKKIHE